MRTDTERLDYLLAIIEAQDDDAAEKLSAAHTLGLKGRPMVDAAMGAKLVEPGEPMPELTALDLAVAELGRIRNVKGFSEERDDAYQADDLAYAAVTYITPAEDRCDGGGGPDSWPWDREHWKPSPDDRKRELTKGIALALCELDRLIRAERREAIEAHLDSPEHRASVEAACEPEGRREFKVGDRVRVVRRAIWDGWMPGMDCYEGNGTNYEITERSGLTACVDGWYFPVDCLEHVDG